MAKRATERRITLDYAPRRIFLPFHARRERFSVLVVHRRGGKTVACVNDLIRAAMTNPRDHARYGYIAPYLKQAKEIAWEYLKRYAKPLIARVNESELWVELINGSRIRIYGADNYEALRGAYFDGVVLDEYAQFPPLVWGTIIRPMLVDRQGWAVFIGTPQGRNDFYRMLQFAKENSWFFRVLPASVTGILPQSELDLARADMTEEQYAQEFECSFDAAILGAYYANDIAQAEKEGRVTNVPYDPLLPLYTAWDLGMADSTAIWVWQPSRDGVRVIDYQEANSKPLSFYVEALNHRGYLVAHDFVPHDAKVRELSTGRTRLETLVALGRKPRLVPAHTVADGINAVRVSMRQVWFDAQKCKDGLEALRQYRADYDDKGKVFTGRPKHDWTSHAADAFRYLAMSWRELRPVLKPPAKKDELAFEVNERGQIIGNMSVREIVELEERKRKYGY